MDKLIEIIVMLLLIFFLVQCTFTGNVEKIGHNAFVKIGINDEIQELDEMIRR